MISNIPFILKTNSPELYARIYTNYYGIVLPVALHDWMPPTRNIYNIYIQDKTSWGVKPSQCARIHTHTHTHHSPRSLLMSLLPSPRRTPASSVTSVELPGPRLHLRFEFDVDDGSASLCVSLIFVIHTHTYLTYKYSHKHLHAGVPDLRNVDPYGYNV